MAVQQASVDGNLAATYTYIYSFLLKKEHSKAAEALKKAVKDVVVLKDGMVPDGPSLDVVIKEWKELKEKAASKSSDSSDSDSDSESSSEESSSDSSSDSSDSDSDSDSSSSSSPSPKAKSKAKATIMVQPSKAKSASPARSSKTLSSDASDSDSDSDDSSSSDDDSDGDDEKKSKSKGTEAEKTETKKPKVKKTQESSSDSSSSDSSSSDSSSEDSDSSSSSESSDSDSDSEESDSDSDDEKEKKSETKAKAEAGKDEVKVTKKRRTDEDGASVPTAVTHNARESETPNKSQSATPKPDGKHNGNEKNGKKPRKSNTPFQRVKLEQVKFADERLKDNRFESRGASASDYGAKAARDLIVTRGAGFRKEKNKKKRGSYRGGEITMESHSIKFND